MWRFKADAMSRSWVIHVMTTFSDPPTYRVQHKLRTTCKFSILVTVVACWCFAWLCAFGGLYGHRSDQNLWPDLPSFKCITIFNCRKSPLAALKQQSLHKSALLYTCVACRSRCNYRLDKPCSIQAHLPNAFIVKILDKKTLMKFW